MSNTIWWGNHQLAIDEQRRWQMAGLLLHIQRDAQEWQIAYHRSPNQHEDDHDWQIIEHIDRSPMPEKALLQRYIYNQTQQQIHLKPCLADRSVVIKPITPLFLSSNQQTTLFVSTPLWLNIFSDDDNLLLDIPFVRPTDTWFGATPIRGEICYATKVFGRLALEQLPIRAFRAVTPIHIVNHHTKAIQIERINIPAPLLPLYAAQDGRLWTPTIEVEQLANGRTPKVSISKHLHPKAGNVKLLNQARQHDDDNLINLFEHFFE